MLILVGGLEKMAVGVLDSNLAKAQKPGRAKAKPSPKTPGPTVGGHQSSGSGFDPRRKPKPRRTV
ncbi:hypothetical protein ARMGADRAFT_123534 [Armillaria gallica]|uniref:Uncharacterized protein n=1 Tax=Armillaria gallica TaxID=47427 RepID=A0A2H3DR90_ARMGA|nr:hypothetical protein ARMGADRAFT_123534 [Armillaria gallica]